LQVGHSVAPDLLQTVHFGGAILTAGLARRMTNIIYDLGLETKAIMLVSGLLQMVE